MTKKLQVIFRLKAYKISQVSSGRENESPGFSKGPSWGPTKVEALKKLEAQETNQIGSAVKKREAQWRRVDSMHAMNLLLIEIFVYAEEIYKSIRNFLDYQSGR